jgi:hypothetical protein
VPKFDLETNSRESVLPEYFEHPDVGYLEFDPNTLYINGNREGQKPINKPLAMLGKFFGSKQPGVPTCSEPGPGNQGCAKWYGCPMKKYMHVGPGVVIMEKHGKRSMSHCYDFFETTRGGRATSQLHHGLDGWKLNTEATTIDVWGRTHAFESGKLNVNSTPAEIQAVRPKAGQMEIGGLLAPWWPLMKKKGLELPQQAENYPELTEDDGEGDETNGKDGPGSVVHGRVRGVTVGGSKGRGKKAPQKRSEGGD